MKNKVLSLSVALTILLAAHTASAGFYVSGGLGIADVDEKGFDNAFGVQVFGGYQFTRHVAAQIGYVNLGKFDADSDTRANIGGAVGVTMDSGSISIDGIEISVLGILPINDNLSLFGKAGIYAWNSEIKVTASAAGQTASSTSKDDDVDTLIGIGVEYAFNPSWSVTGQLTRYDAFESDLTYFGVGARFRF